MKILNAGDVKLSAEEVQQIRDLMVALAAIEYEDYINRKSKGIGHKNFKINEPRKAA
jgi:hypothetical protein